MSAGLKMLKGIPKTPFNIVMIALTAVIMVAFSILSISFSTVFYILIGGAIGVIAYLICTYGKVKKDVKEAENK
jgi:chromate transporter